MGGRIKKAGLVAGTLILVGGCQNIGPMAIDAGRDHYNTTFQSTAKVQTLSNIIRVYAHDSTSFVDVTEVVATTTMTGTGGSALSGIGSKPGAFGLLGSVTGGMTYTEQPTVHYAPLTGKALVSQMVSPLTPDAIESLITSNWPAVAVLDLAALNLTPDQHSSFAALNIISSLASDHAVMLVAGKSGLTSTSSPAPATGVKTRNADPAGSANRDAPNDSLMIYRRPPDPASKGTPNQKNALQLWAMLSSIYRGTQKDSANFIELRTAPVPAKMITASVTTGVPLLKTYSGIGILKNATERPGPKIRFVSRDLFEQITAEPWNRKALEVGFYMLLPDDEHDDDNPRYKREPQLAYINPWVKDWLRGYDSESDEEKYRLMYYPPKSNLASLSDRDFIDKNRRLGTLRRYLLIIEDDVAPGDAYASYSYRGKWYYIDAHDRVSQTNFNLISALLTMMAVPSTVPPITTTVSAGGG